MSGRLVEPAARGQLPTAENPTAQRREHERLRIASCNVLRQRVAQERRNRHRSRLVRLRACRNTIRPLTSVTASTISSRPRIVSTRRTRSAVASPHRSPVYAKHEHEELIRVASVGQRCDLAMVEIAPLLARKPRKVNTCRRIRREASITNGRVEHRVEQVVRLADP